MCAFWGEWENRIVVGSGPDQGPVSSEYSALWIEYQGGVQISGGLGGSSPDSITNQAQTFTPDQTRLPSPIAWSADFFLGYGSCTVEYEGQTYTGGPVAGPPQSDQPVGTTEYLCSVSFPCEGGISPFHT